MRRWLAGAVVLVYICSTVFFCNGISTVQEREFDITATDLGVMCISTAYPEVGIKLADSRDNETSFSEYDDDGKVYVLESDEPSTKPKDEESSEPSGDPKVLILHTHATESYLPSSEGNFHTKEELNTVRDVGNVLAETLEARGIAVIHDKTLHDNPSYNNSYYRSYETAKAILEKYPSIEVVIDLHRDATSSTSPSATVNVKGQTCAIYSYVVGTTASTYSQNKAFISSLNSTAANKYSGFTGKVIERGYQYNQGLSNKYLLLEIGFNRNQIEHCRNTAKIFGNILADTL